MRGRVTTLPDSPPASSQPSTTPPSSFKLHVSGFEESIASLSIDGKESGLTLNVMAYPNNRDIGLQKGQEKTLLYSKTLTTSNLMLKPFAYYKPESEETLTLPLPEGSRQIEVEIVGLESGIKSSESMVVSSAMETNTVIANLDTTPLMFPLDANEAPVNIGLIMPVVEDIPKEDQKENQKSRLAKAEQTEGDGNGRMGLFSIDIETGALYQLNSVQMGQGGNGSIGTFTSGGSLGFLFKKGQEDKEDGFELKTFIRSNDGSMKPITLPAGTDQTTVARDSDTGNIYFLNSQEESLTVQQVSSDGTLKEIQRVATGAHPIAIFLLQSSRILLVVNQGANTLSSFSILGDGTLTALQTISTGPKPLAIAAGPQEKFIYVSNDDSTISHFTLGSDKSLTLVETTPTTHKLASLQFDPSGGILTGLRFSPGMEEQQSTLASQRMKSKLSKWAKKHQKELSIVATVVLAVAIGVAVAAYAPALVPAIKAAVSIPQICVIPATTVKVAVSAKVATGMAAAGGSLIEGYKRCKKPWEKGQACVGGKVSL